jgi:hypothetical protein
MAPYEVSQHKKARGFLSMFWMPANQEKSATKEDEEKEARQTVMECDHQVGLWADYDGGSLIRLSECLAGTYWIIEMAEWFQYCPQCGIDIRYLVHRLQDAIPTYGNISSVYYGGEDGDIVVVDNQGLRHEVPRVLASFFEKEGAT